jgi:hypothetical protein
MIKVFSRCFALTKTHSIPEAIEPGPTDLAKKKEYERPKGSQREHEPEREECPSTWPNFVRLFPCFPLGSRTVLRLRRNLGGVRTEAILLLRQKKPGVRTGRSTSAVAERLQQDKVLDEVFACAYLRQGTSFGASERSTSTRGIVEDTTNVYI